MVLVVYIDDCQSLLIFKELQFSKQTYTHHRQKKEYCQSVIKRSSVSNAAPVDYALMYSDIKEIWAGCQMMIKHLNSSAKSDLNLVWW